MARERYNVSIDAINFDFDTLYKKDEYDLYGCKLMDSNNNVVAMEWFDNRWSRDQYEDEIGAFYNGWIRQRYDCVCHRYGNSPFYDEPCKVHVRLDVCFVA